MMDQKSVMSRANEEEATAKEAISRNFKCFKECLKVN